MNKAFTIVEIIVVICIIILLTGTSIASYNGFTQSKELDTEAQKVKDVLNLAAKKAVAADASNCPNKNESTLVNFYGIITNTVSYTLYVNCTTDTVQTETNINTFVLPNGYKFTSSNAIQFYPLNRGSSSFSITVINSKTGKSKCIDVRGTGLIDEPYSC